MFKKTLLRLTIWNFSVFLLFFLCFSYILYRYVADETYRDTDDALARKAHVFVLGRDRQAGKRDELGFLDPRIFVFWHNSAGVLFSEAPLPVAERDKITEQIEQLNNQPQTHRIGNHVYRLWRQSIAQPSADMADLVTVALIDSEAAVLLHLFRIIMISLFFGGLTSAVASYFLAKRSLVPIQASWDKQQRFVADASHELRTPIAIIQSSTELLLRHPERTIQAELKRLRVILSEAIRMGNLIGTLLTLARSDANRLELEKTFFSFSELLLEIIEQFRPLVEQKKLALTESIAKDLFLVGDQERLRQLVIIFLDNAVKYTPPGGLIELYCAREQEQIMFKITDTGCGIAAEDIPFVFDRFFRSDKGRNRQSGGTGLGLAIAQWIVDQHKGKVRLESVLGAGTTISVWLPL
ncbi:MAG: ATP-binding protein [Sporomusaceae bacterium]|nr:ATP-binding protein [Sporomusaceae bacterium]